MKIFVGGKLTDFSMDSGAGKVMVSIAVRIASIRMLVRRCGIGCSMLFFDEVFAMLDAVNRRGIMEFILDTLREFGFEQIFCISHQKDVSDMLRDNVLITKGDKYSKIGWL
ncbi:hypothetical protein D3C75_876990 [compost metagenome]